MIIEGNFPCTLVFYQPRRKVYGTVDGPKYYVSPNGLEILINAEFKIGSDQLPFIKRFREIIEKHYRAPGNPASDGDLDLEEICGGGGRVNDETEDVLPVIDGEGWDEDDDAIDYIHSDDAVVSKMLVMNNNCI